jgi:hypothetical protein
VDQEKKRKAAIAEKVKAAVESKKSNKAVRLEPTALSGRDLFTFDPSLFIDDADAADDEEMEIKGLEEEVDEDEEKKNEAPPEVNDESLFLDEEDVPSDAD